MDNSFIILKYNGFSDRAPCTKLHKGEQKDRTKTLAQFPDHILNDYGLMQTRERIWENLKVYIIHQTLSSVCIRLYRMPIFHFPTQDAIFYFFYKIRLGNMLWRHNRACIASYKHGIDGNWLPITACIRHNLFYKYIYSPYIYILICKISLFLFA